ncbi:MAG: helix-turn-helix domain-containing protein [Hyphomicrobium sp.]|uniref:helix-turn-helix domain-containing protein n=1 Tax=Hyphomicrobium sp. TaxID=82 RepID=UPI003D1488A4
MLASHPIEIGHIVVPARRAPGQAGSGDLAERMRSASIRKLESKEHVFCEGDPRIHVFQVEEGVIAIYKTLSDGRRRIIDFAYPGDLIGLGAGKEHILSAQATCRGKVRCHSAASLEALAESDAGLAIKLYRSVCQELEATRDLLVAVGQRGAVERLASFLLALRRKDAKDPDTVRLAMRRSDIADLLGLTIETVSRTLSKLRAMRVIDVEQGGTTVTLRDIPRLTELSNA